MVSVRKEEKNFNGLLLVGYRASVGSFTFSHHILVKNGNIVGMLRDQ